MHVLARYRAREPVSRTSAGGWHHAACDGPKELPFAVLMGYMGWDQMSGVVIREMGFGDVIRGHGRRRADWAWDGRGWWWLWW